MSAKTIRVLKTSIKNHYHKLISSDASASSYSVSEVELKHDSKKSILKETLYFSIALSNGKMHQDFIITHYYMPTSYTIEKFISSLNFINYSKYNFELMKRIRACKNNKKDNSSKSSYI